MANLRMAAKRLLDKHELDAPDDFLREMMELFINGLMQAEVSTLVGAEPYERAATRTNWRNGTRRRQWDTRVGSLELAIPKVREGTYFPSFLEPRLRSERAMLSVIQEAYVAGVSTRKVDRLVRSLGIDGVSKSQVSRICSELDEMVEAWRHRPLDEPIAYMWLDATFPKVRENGRVTSMGAVVAVGVTYDGHRRILGIDVGATESGEFWTLFLRSLIARGLSGVRLVTSDAHEGLKGAIATVLVGASWQRCRVHFMRNVLGHVNRSDSDMVMALVRTIFAQATPEATHAQFDTVVGALSNSHPRVAEMLMQAEPDLLAFTAFPPDHWKKIWSTNPLERLIREIKRRIDVVGIFPNRPAVTRLIGALLMEQDDEWVAGRRYLSSSSMAPLVEAPSLEDEEVTL